MNDESEMQPWELRELKDAKEAVKVMHDFVNTMGDGHLRMFVELFLAEHRTLQQSLTKLCLMWFKKLAHLEDHWFDGRNVASQEAAKKIMAALDDCDHLPFI